MGFISFILSALVAFGGTATGFCATPQPTEEQMRTARNLQVREAVSRFSMNSLAANTTDINIKVYAEDLYFIPTISNSSRYYHVVADSGSNGDGYLSELEHQTQVLNARYAPHNIAWTHGGAEWTVAPNWSNNQNEQAMSKKLRKGTYADLNVYLTSTIDFAQVYHTFQGGCWGEGDGIDDTPAEAPHSIEGCDLNRNSCPGGGPDPVTNYMDYSDQ
ncbi:hypothetical protein N0V83_009471 [Neocucurbitaria cava]|uniref:Peptidase M43 pregnancy-associated plasma-A domain-containing protein n=1 Tax=Neocucurbitaria cava TaxID=798079 RepID=A0A9W8Y259_9PLEO|nr:hypothetical protein N0V83_009471 [Neocucurbitaria cava]